MTVARLPNPPARYSWSVVLPHPRDRGRRSSAPALNASEQMFFFGAPLAHVVQYEEHLRAGRQERAIRQLARTRRPFNLAAQLTALQDLPPVVAESACS